MKKKIFFFYIFNEKIEFVSSMKRLKCGFYRAMNNSAKRGIAIACRPSVRLSIRLSVCMSVRLSKFVALPIPEIIGATQKNLGSPCISPRSVFSIIFNRLLFAFGLRRAKVLG